MAELGVYVCMAHCAVCVVEFKCTKIWNEILFW